MAYITLLVVKIYLSENGIKELAFIEYRKFIGTKKTLEELLNFSCQGILIGDLIYDTYLKKYNMSNNELHGGDFKFFLLEFLNLFYFWVNYF